MALQYQSYLFASSPPGFELLSSKWLQKKMLGNDFENNKNRLSSDFKDVESASKSPKEYEFKDARLLTTRDRELDKKRIQDWESSYDFDLDESEDHSIVFSFQDEKSPKKVLFADDYGQTLTQVVVASEPTDVPPTLNPETIKKIEKTLPGFHLEQNPFDCSPDDGTLLTLDLINFREPHSDLLNLHNRVERLGVTLASIGPRQGRKVGGTIEIKKRSKEVTACLRFTRDSWKTYEDVVASFVSVVGGTDHVLLAFEFEVWKDVHKVELEFALCCRDLDGSFECWDNNEGSNYKISCHDDYDLPRSHPSSCSWDAGGSHVHRIMSAPGDLAMWGVHDFEDALQPYW